MFWSANTIDQTARFAVCVFLFAVSVSCTSTQSGSVYNWIIFTVDGMIILTAAFRWCEIHEVAGLTSMSRHPIHVQRVVKGA